MRLYHGSAVVVRKPEYDLGKPYNDYGRGFYCTEDTEQMTVIFHTHRIS